MRKLTFLLALDKDWHDAFKQWQHEYFAYTDWIMAQE